jgi:hypothetical protein
MNSMAIAIIHAVTTVALFAGYFLKDFTLSVLWAIWVLVSWALLLLILMHEDRK